MMFKNEGKLKETERWKMSEQNNEVSDKFNYLGVTLDGPGGWNKQKILTKTEGYLVAIDRCI